jgi:hypothetical protein
MNKKSDIESKSIYPPAIWWTRNGLPVPKAEKLFYTGRKWRFDYFFPAELVAVEIEGGAYKYGRHNRPHGFFADMEKYNAAAEMGIRLLRYPSINKIDCEQIKRTFRRQK